LRIADVRSALDVAPGVVRAGFAKALFDVADIAMLSTAGENDETHDWLHWTPPDLFIGGSMGQVRGRFPIEGAMQQTWRGNLFGDWDVSCTNR
jgi:hypothetical protein